MNDGQENALYELGVSPLDESRVAGYLGVSLDQLVKGLSRGAPTRRESSARQEALQSLARSIGILERVFEKRSDALAWWHRPHDDLGRRTPVEVVLSGHGDAVHDMLESALIGTPS